MPKKAFYRSRLPHFQQPGQAYFITWSLNDAVPSKALIRYTNTLREIKSQIGYQKRIKAEKNIIDNLVHKYYMYRSKYIKAYDDLLHVSKKPFVDLSKTANINILQEAFHFFEGKKLFNFAWAIMPNHVHWVLQLLQKDGTGEPVYLEDIMRSIKRFSAVEINKSEGRKGKLWQKESFDTTIRNDIHLYNAIKYTINNPVKAGYVKDWRDWDGCWCNQL